MNVEQVQRSKSVKSKMGNKSPDIDLLNSSYRIIDFANQGLPLADFLNNSIEFILEKLCSNFFRLIFREESKVYLCEGKLNKGSLNISLREQAEFGKTLSLPDKGGAFQSEQLLLVGKQTIGRIVLEWSTESRMKKALIPMGHMVHALAIGLQYRNTHIALRERVKELSCLYELAKISSTPDISVDEIMKRTVDLLPPAWLYPECSHGRIILNDVSYSTGAFKESDQRLVADINISGRKRGTVEVHYSEEKPQLDEGPFLKEERNLINAIARELSLIVERKEAEFEKQKLQGQIMHADRLATLGQLAAGVAHEINEPLANILGFAQLAGKTQNIPHQTKQDIEKIVSASMHAREVIKKLLVFSRQTIPSKSRININDVVDEGLYFFEARCKKMGIELEKEFKKDIPLIRADASQLNQVLINLVVNAIHATPEGGQITVRTYDKENGVGFVISDTGIGMKKDILEKIFLPFFTTKDIDEGTGLGLPVVHGIVTAHGGSINAESMPGFGSSFDVFIPFDIKKQER